MWYDLKEFLEEFKDVFLVRLPIGSPHDRAKIDNAIEVGKNDRLCHIFLTINISLG